MVSDLYPAGTGGGQGMQSDGKVCAYRMGGGGGHREVQMAQTRRDAKGVGTAGGERKQARLEPGCDWLREEQTYALSLGAGWLW